MERDSMPGKESMIFFGVTAAASAFVFITIGCFRRPKTKSETSGTTYDIMERSGKRIALQNPSNISWLMGLMYATLFYCSLPVLIWRYGKALSLLFIVTPFALSFAITCIVSSDGGTKFFLGIVLKVIIRAIGGLIIVSNDTKLYRKALVSRGWEMKGSSKATSRKNAMNFSPA